MIKRRHYSLFQRNTAILTILTLSLLFIIAYVTFSIAGRISRQQKTLISTIKNSPDAGGNDFSAGKSAENEKNDTVRVMFTSAQTEPSENSMPIKRKYNISIEACQSLSGMEGIDCIVELAYGEKKPEYCLRIKDPGFEDECLSHYAIANGISSCEVAKNLPEEYVFCILEMTQVKGDPSYCDPLIDDKPNYMQSMCRLQVDLLNYYSNASDCMKIGEKTLQTYCMAAITSNTSLCGHLDGDPSLGQWLSKQCLMCVPKGKKFCYLTYEGDKIVPGSL